MTFLRASLILWYKDSFIAKLVYLSLVEHKSVLQFYCISCNLIFIVSTQALE